MCITKHNTRITLSDILFNIIQGKKQHKWTNKDLIAAINETKGPLNTRSLRDRLNPTRDGLAMGLATGLESAQPIATALTPPGTQTPTPITP